MREADAAHPLLDRYCCCWALCYDWVLLGAVLLLDCYRCCWVLGCYHAVGVVLLLLLLLGVFARCAATLRRLFLVLLLLCWVLGVFECRAATLRHLLCCMLSCSPSAALSVPPFPPALHPPL